MTGFEPQQVQARLARSWSSASSTRYTPENPALGQCSATALVVQKVFGGALLKTRVGEAWHGYNRIGGVAYDFTAAQFLSPLAYDDVPTTRDEALADTSERQLAVLAEAFRRG